MEVAEPPLFNHEWLSVIITLVHLSNGNNYKYILETDVCSDNPTTMFLNSLDALPFSSGRGRVSNDLSGLLLTLEEITYSSDNGSTCQVRCIINGNEFTD